MWNYYNPNPISIKTIDCSVRALCKALNKTWEAVYVELVLQGFLMCTMPSSNSVWGSVLRKHGFYRTAPDVERPESYTAADFLQDHPKGTFVLSFDEHVATAVDGILYDSWDSSGEIPQFYWYRKED